MVVAGGWQEYELIDAGAGQRLERWGAWRVVRPDPQILWPAAKSASVWGQAHARYVRSSSGGGHWENRGALPERWSIARGPLRFYIRPTDFKHMGLFPEQAANWDWLQEKIRAAACGVRVLNLFAYTGGATVAAAAAGAQVCHVDAAKGMVAWAKENTRLSGVDSRAVRFIADDVLKFLRREERRGSRYDAVIMDPPSYGRGTQGQAWKIEKMLLPLLEQCRAVLTPQPLFFLINGYTAGYSPLVLQNLLAATLGTHLSGIISCGEVALPVTGTGIVVPCGIYSRWERDG
ncbi:MAG: class I SAM-dependent methyltransferase [Candidatus Omnitrophica bacterium]|nr:class I SAM-dependent methyltransferase [Candidatus Omnitrophota bacterium]